MKIERALELAVKFTAVLGNNEVKKQLKVLYEFINQNATEDQLKEAVAVVEKIANEYSDSLDHNTCSVIYSCMKFAYSPEAIIDIRYYAQKVYDEDSDN